MKKKIAALLLSGVFALSLVACGDDVKGIKYDVNDYVTLGEYKGIEVTLTGDYEYTDEGFENYFNNQLQSSGIFVEDSSQTEVLEDSIVNVDYVGSKDGVAFDGGSAENQTLDIANNCQAGSGGGFIGGFTSGLVGHKVGDEVAYEVTFPEQYQAADLAGQTVIFTFNVNYIAKQISTKDDLTDEIVAEKFGAESVDAYVESTREQYKSMLEQNLKNDTETAVLNTLINNCTVSEIPEDLLQARVDLIVALQDRQYAQYGMTMKEFAEASGYNYDEVLANLTENVKESTKTELILEAIADKEGIEVDGGYNDFVLDIYTKLGYTDTTKFYEDYSVEGFDGQRYFELAYRTEKATDFCVENAVVTFANSEDTTASED